jgi:hypothetical protein
VDRRHQAALDADRLVQHLGHRREAVRGARRVGDDVVLVGVVGVVEVHAERHRHVRLSGRRGDDHLLRAGFEVLGGVVALGEEAGRLDDDVGADVGPRERRRVALGEHADLAAVDRERAVADLDGPRERPVHRVVLQEVAERLGVRDVVDRDDLDVRVRLVRGAEDVAADASEAVDPDAYGHGGVPLRLVEGPAMEGTRQRPVRFRWAYRSRATFCGTPGTRSSSSRVAAITASGEPK